MRRFKKFITHYALRSRGASRGFEWIGGEVRLLGVKKRRSIWICFKMWILFQQAARMTTAPRTASAPRTVAAFMHPLPPPIVSTTPLHERRDLPHVSRETTRSLHSTPCSRISSCTICLPLNPAPLPPPSQSSPRKRVPAL